MKKNTHSIQTHTHKHIVSIDDVRVYMVCVWLKKKIQISFVQFSKWISEAPSMLSGLCVSSQAINMYFLSLSFFWYSSFNPNRKRERIKRMDIFFWETKKNVCFDCFKSQLLLLFFRFHISRLCVCVPLTY